MPLENNLLGIQVEGLDEMVLGGEVQVVILQGHGQAGHRLARQLVNENILKLIIQIQLLPSLNLRTPPLLLYFDLLHLPLDGLKLLGQLLLFHYDLVVHLLPLLLEGRLPQLHLPHSLYRFLVPHRKLLNFEIILRVHFPKLQVLIHNPYYLPLLFFYLLLQKLYSLVLLQ